VPTEEEVAARRAELGAKRAAEKAERHAAHAARQAEITTAKEAKAAKTPAPAPAPAAAPAKPVLSAEEREKLNARALRFGLPTLEEKEVAEAVSSPFLFLHIYVCNGLPLTAH